jgi:iron complex outermembrane receptor protein
MDFAICMRGLLLGVCVLGTPLLASAQVANGAAAGAQATEELQEIVVTAQKRSENAQSVPIAITAFTAQALQDKSITDVSGLTLLTPNANFDTASPFGGANEVLSASIRGIGQDDFGLNLDPGVGVYVDGVYYARTTGANVNMLDVDRVEILKGPQGTLFGRNTIGGAISIVTRPPGDEFKTNLQVTTGSFNRRDIQATADIPFSDTVLSTFTFASLNRDGYQQRIPYSTPVPYTTDGVNAFASPGTATFSSLGGQGQDSFRGKVLWKAAANFTVTATVDVTHIDESSTPINPLVTAASPTIPGAGLGFIYNFCVQGIAFVPTAQTLCGPRGPGLTAAGTTNTNVGIWQSTHLLYGNQFVTQNIDQSYATGPDFNIMNPWGTSLTLDWSLNEATDLKSITAFRRLSWNVALDTDGSPTDMNLDAQKQEQHQVSQEFQLTGSAIDKRLQYATGLYFFNEGGFEHDYVTIADGLLQINGTDTIDTTSYAAYAHADYSITDEFKAIAGARYSYDHKTITVFQEDLNAFNYKISGCYPVTAACAAAIGFPVPGKPLLYVPDNLNSRNFDVFTPTLGLQYQIAPAVMAYTTYSKGYKDGGWTTRLTQPVPSLPTFGPEKSQTYEVGLKSEWLDHRLQANVAGFYTKYDGIQLNFQQGLSPTIQNAGDAQIEGSELELRWLVGAGLSLQASAGYLDAHYTYLEPGVNGAQRCIQPWQPCITLESQLPKTPKWKTAFGPQYLVSLPNEGRLRLGFDYTHTAAMFNDSFNDQLLRRPATDLLNAAVTYISPDDRYELAVGGTNITDRRFLITGNEDTSSGLIYGTYNAPSEWFLSLRGRF